MNFYVKRKSLIFKILLTIGDRMVVRICVSNHIMSTYKEKEQGQREEREKRGKDRSGEGRKKVSKEGK